ncbi:hypothetical protein [Pseudarthrobacter sp. S9]|uniref:hypothetical protein n=1 Tax=Pseudarthrobacter sp. S9 TaxID=3418421 RepID=UPI003D000CA2
MEAAELRNARKRIRLLEQENEILNQSRTVSLNRTQTAATSLMSLFEDGSRLR